MRSGGRRQGDDAFLLMVRSGVVDAESYDMVLRAGCVISLVEAGRTTIYGTL